MTTINDTLHVGVLFLYIIYLFIIITIIILPCVGGKEKDASLVYVATRGQTTAVTRSYYGHQSYMWQDK